MICSFANLAAFGLVLTLSATPAFAMDKPLTDPGGSSVEQQQRVAPAAAAAPAAAVPPAVAAARAAPA